MNQKKLLPEMAADRICNYIDEQHLKEGDKLPNEFQLAKICEVGRSTVREAIRILSFEGKVEVVRGNGTFVRCIHPEPFINEYDPMGFKKESHLMKRALEFFDVRLMLEPELAAQAALMADEEDKKKLVELEKKVKRCILEGKDHRDADIQFHKQIAKCSKNSVAYHLMDLITQGILVFVEMTNNSLSEETLSSHHLIVEAILNRDATGARCNMIGHLNHNRKVILEKHKVKTGN